MSINRRQRRAERAGPRDRGAAPGRTADLFAQAIRRHQTGALAEAVVLYEQALAHDPNVPEALANLGLALRDLGRLDEACGRYERALMLKPNIPEVLSNFGLVLKDLGRLEEAIAHYRQALALRPNYPEALSNLGNALRDQGKREEAIACFQQALALKPDYPQALSNLGNALRDEEKLDQAIALYERALALKPDLPETLGNLGNVLHEHGKVDEAVVRFEQALALRPNLLEAVFGLANALKDRGKLDEAIVRYEQAVELKPNDADIHSNLLLALHYSERHCETNTLSQARRFAHHVEPSNRHWNFANVLDAERRLRIGYVSPDFRVHPIGIFLGNVLAAHDRAQVEVYCYSNSDYSDDVTIGLREAADHWRIIAGTSDADADAMIRRDGIDILIDLSGHTAKNRLPLFALKPAPVQINWIGYFDTTGLDSMDYVLADRFVVPPGDEASFTEAIWRLPDSYLCFRPPSLDVPIVDRPAGTDRPLTLGCFNNWSKVSSGTIALWARILALIPDSRLFLKAKYLDNPGMRHEAAGRFAAHGIGPERLILEGHSPRAEMLASYNRVDIALDPFPFGGGTTTAETLWMGVPVVTLRGKRWVGRISESILTTVGLVDLVADDHDAYTRIVLSLAKDRSYLGELQRRLRPMMESSPFCDGPRFARALDAGYRSMWEDWCSRHPTQDG